MDQFQKKKKVTMNTMKKKSTKMKPTKETLSSHNLLAWLATSLYM